ncbi:MAG: capsular biosynthesis protein [Neomegalonema sp.]|nr:capsular biosynthesis protein [Neomegalonema sp.]
MSMMLAGFRSTFYPQFRDAGFDISVYFYGGQEPPVGPTGSTLVVSEGVRFGFFNGAYDPELDVELANRVRARALPIFSRTFLRSHARQNGPAPDWATVRYYFENALNYYHQLLRERRIKTIVFWIIPHEGNFSLLYHLAQEMGVKTVVCHQAYYGNSFWMMDRIEDYGVSPIENDHGAVIPFNPQPETMFYVKGLQKPLRRSKWFGEFAGMSAKIAGRALALEFLWRPRAFEKSVNKLRYAWRRYKHQGMNDEHFLDEIKHDKFIYFPLHHQPELSADILGRRYNDQTLAIEELRRAVPEDVAIYVKENPRQTALMRGDAFFKRIEALPNTHLVRHFVSTLELSRRCMMLATVTGSAAYEALQMGKPALQFGDAWFRGLAGVYDASIDAKDAYEKACAFEFDEEALRQTVAAKAKRLWNGVVDHLAVPDPENFKPDENLRIVVASIAEYIERSSHEPDAGSALGAGS